eukprot:scaffold239137_cov31-Tisochrysis_lutea.AAC.3
MGSTSSGGVGGVGGEAACWFGGLGGLSFGGEPRPWGVLSPLMGGTSCVVEEMTTPSAKITCSGGWSAGVESAGCIPLPSKFSDRFAVTIRQLSLYSSSSRS